MGCPGLIILGADPAKRYCFGNWLRSQHHFKARSATPTYRSRGRLRFFLTAIVLNFEKRIYSSTKCPNSSPVPRGSWGCWLFGSFRILVPAHEYFAQLGFGDPRPFQLPQPQVGLCHVEG